MKDRDLELAPTAPCGSSVSVTIAAEVVLEAREVLTAMPTGEWRRSMKARLSGLQEALDGWKEAEPTVDERKRVTTAAIELFGELSGLPTQFVRSAIDRK